MNSATYLLTHHLPSPVERVHDPLFEKRSLAVFIKRDDLLCLNDNNAFSGNKWRKLKYNLLEARRLNHTSLLTFGGAYSNHLAAVAEAGQLFDFQTIGIIRGEETLPLNPTLQYCSNNGMLLHYVDRQQYRHKDDSAFINTLNEKFGKFYLVPEGGTNVLAIKGVAEIIPEVESQLQVLPDFVAVACGTGGTLAGVIAGLDGHSQALGISVLKGDFLQQDITQHLLNYNNKHYNNWHLQTDYPFGGYAKFTPELIQFINYFKKNYTIPLDPIYTGKLMFALFDLIQKDFFPPGSTILAIHTGGLQGIAGFNERHKFILD